MRLHGIRALEASLMTDQVIDQLVNSQGEKQCLEILRERGWGDGGNDLDAEEMLKIRRKENLGSDSRDRAGSAHV